MGPYESYKSGVQIRDIAQSMLQTITRVLEHSDQDVKARISFVKRELMFAADFLDPSEAQDMGVDTVYITNMLRFVKDIGLSYMSLYPCERATEGSAGVRYIMKYTDLSERFDICVQKDRDGSIQVGSYFIYEPETTKEYQATGQYRDTTSLRQPARQPARQSGGSTISSMMSRQDDVKVTSVYNKTDLRQRPKTKSEQHAEAVQDIESWNKNAKNLREQRAEKKNRSVPVGPNYLESIQSASDSVVQSVLGSGMGLVPTMNDTKDAIAGKSNIKSKSSMKPIGEKPASKPKEKFSFSEFKTASPDDFDE